MTILSFMIHAWIFSSEILETIDNRISLKNDEFMENWGALFCNISLE